ncbi:GNAT family N-acetyltransferase [Lacticaseibacillus nasuensis]|uniref:GNAT family N-acetyltransferase n=1 Tax=Lacticaseibacillus nasuensis TaxID=944671 RepID=UPI0022473023|nr:GNAT family N-acetyltransferase [Lacticaseibacillus nasuensis]MCX2456174.1 GNAT family N-acetyltransferase [Lacticaseibacillus nasuensis]
MVKLGDGQMFVELATPSQLTATKLSRLGFTSHFDWTAPLASAIVVGELIGRRLVGLIAFERQPENLANHVNLLEVRQPARGLHHGARLLAIVAQDAFRQPGFDGYVYLTTKTTGVQRYYESLGASRVHQQIIFAPPASRQLILTYLPKGSEIRWTKHRSTKPFNGYRPN